MDFRAHRKSVILLAILLATSLCAGAVDLKGSVPGWVAVLGGNPICAPARTSSGYAVPSDGRTLSLVSAGGAVIWEKSFRSRLQPFISVGISDMIYTVTKDSGVHMVNPGGVLVWSHKAPFTVTEPPLCGSDGRIFLRGSDAMECVGLNGVSKWTLSLAAQDTGTGAQFFPDGSILCVEKKLSDGKTRAVRVSPFGDVLEEITFASRIAYVRSCAAGIILSFDDGSMGLCTVKDGAALSLWALGRGALGSSSAPRILDVTDGACFMLAGTQVKKIDLLTGEILQSAVSPLDFQTIAYSGLTAQGLAVGDKKGAVCLSPDSLETVWECTFPPQKKWSHMLCTDAGFVVLCTASWSMEAYRVKQVPGKTGVSYRGIMTGAYRQFYAEPGAASSNLTGPAIMEAGAEEYLALLKKGGIAGREARLLPMLDAELSALQEDWAWNSPGPGQERPFFRQNPDYGETIVSLAAASGTLLYQKNIAGLLRLITDRSFLLCVIKAAKESPYDADCTMLSALEGIIRRGQFSKDIVILEAVCDAVYEICRFNGSARVAQKSQQILSYMLFPQYGYQVQKHARSTLDKIIELKL